MPEWLWPSMRADSTPAVRIGRVLHWLATVFAAFCVAAALNLALNGEAGRALEPIVYGIGVYAVGRGFRYALAAE